MEPTVKNCTNSAESKKFHQENLVESTNVANFAAKEETQLAEIIESYNQFVF